MLLSCVVLLLLLLSEEVCIYNDEIGTSSESRWSIYEGWTWGICEYRMFVYMRWCVYAVLWFMGWVIHRCIVGWVRSSWGGSITRNRERVNNARFACTWISQRDRLRITVGKKQTSASSIWGCVRSLSCRFTTPSSWAHELMLTTRSAVSQTGLSHVTWTLSASWDRGLIRKKQICISQRYAAQPQLSHLSHNL